mmetsp:Transcript_41102/g.46704  ORF Transcript_41102/g.46704 Transcript_41102/m.46704 type:complete len:1174 (+) Transcript_41102:96-3617(+)
MSSRKRRFNQLDSRTRNSDKNEDSHVVNEEDEELLSPKRQAVESEDGSRHRSHDSEGFEDEEDDISPKTMNIPGKPASVGILQCVRVENFMCHRKLTVKLCSNVNFISGQNGSGKSAVLAAIQICLGAGARRTHRARQLGELVRKESSSGTARISVTIRNEGSDGFQPEKYGDSIIIERTLSRNGGGSYKLKNATTEKTISSNRKDLTALLDQLNIQVENPVAVLDQEEAKKFLTGKASDKYSFFTKATDLERLDRTYADVSDSIEELENNGKRVESSLSNVVDTVKRLKAEVEQFTQLEEWEDKISDTRRIQAWAALKEIHSDYEQAQAHHSMAEEKLIGRQKVYDELCAVASNDEGRTAKEEHLQALTRESEEASQLKRDAELALVKTKAPVRKYQREAKQVEKELGSAREMYAQSQKALQRAQQKAADDHQAKEQAQRLSDLEKHRQKVEELKDGVKRWQQEQSQHLQSYQELEPVVDQAKKRSNNVSKQVYAVQTKRNELKSSQGNAVAVYGGPKAAKLATAVQRMKQAGRWRGPVMGPIGMYVKVVNGKEEFAALAEFGLGNLLDRFIVTNDHDRQLFQKLRREMGCNRECNCFQTKENKRYQIRTCGIDGVETVASCLSIGNDLVFNVLVDQARIDSRALMKSLKHTEEILLQTNSLGRESIRGGDVIREIYNLPLGDVVSINKSGARNMRSNERPLKQIIGADTRAAVQEAEGELKQLEAELKEYKSQESASQKELQEAKQQWNKARQQLRNTNNKLEEIEEIAAKLQGEIDGFNNVEDTDFTELEDDVENCNQDVVALQEKLEAAEKSQEDLLPDIEQAKNKVNELAARNERVLSDLGKAEKDLIRLVTECGEHERKKTRAQQKIQVVQEKLPEIKNMLDERTENYHVALRQARLLQYRSEYAIAQKEKEADGETPDLTPEDPPDEVLEAIAIESPSKQAAYYEAKISRLRKKIVQEKERRNIQNITYEEALDRYTRARKDLQAKNNQLQTIKENVTDLYEDLGSRQKRWKRFRKHYIHMTKGTFDDILNLKGSSGSLEFDHNEKTLNLVVQKDNTNENSQNRDLKALSGGERSFTTLALLVAMGERLETPFRVMDEFDVFLDSIARKIALETLVEIALKLDHRQFIFITPQDLSSITPGKKLKIFKMKPPERSNAGSLSQQVLD